MLGSTHKKIGVALSLVILRPITIPSCLGCMAAGYFGGGLCDIDIIFRNHPAKDEDPNREDYYDGTWEDFASYALLFALYILVDWYIGNGSVDWFLQHVGFQTIAAGAIFGLIIVCGMIAAHRSFMHSIIVGIALSGCLYVICAPLTPAFFIGFASHILLDLLNKSGIRLFWPFKKEFKLNLCSANKNANAILETIGRTVCCLFGAYYLIIGVLNYNQSAKIIEFLNAPFSGGLTNLGAWLIFINIITFFVENIDYSLWLKGKGPYQKHDLYFDEEKDDATVTFMQRNIYFLFVLGGALGGFLSYLVLAHKAKRYIKNGASGIVIPLFGAFSVVLEWVCIYTAIRFPSNCAEWLQKNLVGVNIIYLVIYYGTINILTYILYSRDHEKKDKLTVKKLFELLIALIGGAIGGYLSINLKGFFSAQLMMKNTIAKMVQAHCLIIAMAVVFLYVI